MRELVYTIMMETTIRLDINLWGLCTIVDNCGTTWLLMVKYWFQDQGQNYIIVSFRVSVKVKHLVVMVNGQVKCTGIKQPTLESVKYFKSKTADLKIIFHFEE